MPNTSSATKALRQSKKKKILNDRVRKAFKGAVRSVRENPTAETLTKAASTLDKAAKKHVIPQNKANRLKSRLTALITPSK